jgi:hypothetical protein
LSYQVTKEAKKIHRSTQYIEEVGTVSATRKSVKRKDIEEAMLAALIANERRRKQGKNNYMMSDMISASFESKEGIRERKQEKRRSRTFDRGLEPSTEA